MYDLYTGSPDDMQAKVAYLLQLFQYARAQRVNFEVSWEETAALIWPEYRNSFSFGHIRAPGVKYTAFQVDSSGAIKAGRFMAICDALITPYNMLWSVYEVHDPYVMKQKGVAEYFDRLTNIIWSERYKATAGFQANQQVGYAGLGVFGNNGTYVEEYDSAPLKGDTGLSYCDAPVGEVYLLVNRQNRVDGYIRHFRWTARQAYQKWGAKIPEVLTAAMTKGDVYTLFDFLEFVIPRTDYDPYGIFSGQNRPWSSTTVCVPSYAILEEKSGYYEMPLAHGRYFQAPEEWYGRGPGQQVLPELKTKNAEKEAFLKQGKQAGDPTYLLPEDGMFDFKSESGAYNYGLMSPDGKPLVSTLPTGHIEITKDLMAESDQIIDAAFLNDLFPMLFNKDAQQRSAREVMEVANQMGIFLAPTLGRQYGERLAPMSNRECGILKRQRKLPPVPQVLREAKAVPHCRFTSPLARALNQQGITGFMRTVEMTGTIAQTSGDDSVWDVFDFETAIPEISHDMYAPSRWMASPDKLAQKRKSRAAAKQQQQQVQSLPGQAAIMKAQAISDKAKAGQNIGGALSGTPQGGMPLMPGQQQNGGSTFGFPGLPGRPQGM